jgi:hypothetical protein
MRATISLLFLAFAGWTMAQFPTPEAKLTLPKQAKPGAKVQAVVELTIPDEYHAYQNPPADPNDIPVEVKLDSKTVKLAKVVYPKGTELTMPGMPKPSKVYSGTVKIPVWLVMPAKPGQAEFKLSVRYQICNDKTCYPPGQIPLAGKLLIKK